jgi:hypothetical protein
MKVMVLAFALLFCVSVRAQTRANLISGITLEVKGGTPEYCKGPFRGGRWTFPDLASDDITLRLPLTLRFDNSQAQSFLLTPLIGVSIQMKVVGLTSAPVVNGVQFAGSLDPASLTATPDPLVPPAGFSFVAGRSTDSSTVRVSVQCLSASDPGCISDFVAMPVVKRSQLMDLRGKMVEIVVMRDHSLAPQIVQRLNEMWKRNDVVAGIVESHPLLLQIPDQPQTRDCNPPLQRTGPINR